MWLLSDNGFISVVEFDPPLVTVTPAVYGKTENGYADYKNIIEPAVRGTDRVCQEQIDQLVDYVPKKDSKNNLCSHLLVRARIEEDLAPLKDFDPNAVFFEDKSADYQFRCIINRMALAVYVAHKVTNIDYKSHVKETVNSRAPQIPGGRMGALSSVWSAFAKWQPNSPYGAVSGSMYGHSYGSADRDNDWKSTTGSKGYGGYSTSSSVGTVEKWWNSKKKEDAAWEAKMEALSDDEWEALAPEWLEEIKSDDPGWDMTELEMRVAGGDISAETMRLQLEEIFSEYSVDLDLDYAVELVTDACGTCDISTIETDALWQILEVEETTESNDEPTTNV